MGNIEELLRKRKELLEEIDKEIQKSYTKPVALMFTDIAGSTAYFEKKGDIAGRQMIQTHNDILFPIIKEHGGRVIKTIGDSIMASFNDPLKSVMSAVAMQKALSSYNKGKQEDERIKVRMGLHFGQAVVDERDLFGDVVNTSARV
jgi:adenylate cyclase